MIIEKAKKAKTKVKSKHETFSDSDEVVVKKKKKKVVASDSDSDSDKKSKKKKAKKASSFTVEQEFKGTATLAIFEGDPTEDTQGKFPVIAFGLRKAKAILKHLDEIKDWVENQE